MLRDDPAPPLSASLLLGWPLGFLPTTPVGWLVQRITDGVMRRHPEIGDRLSDFTGKRLLLDPSDLPLAFVLELTGDAPRVEVVTQDHDPASPVHATVRGSLADLVSVVEGRVDGDALFFSRRLCITGEVALVVAIRNAMDGAAIELTDLLPELPGGPIRFLGLRIMRGLGRGYLRLEADLSLLAGAMAGSLRADLTRQTAALDRLQQEVQDLRPSLQRAGRRNREKAETR